MYSERVTESQIQLTESKLRRKLVRHSVSETDEMVSRLASVVDDSGNPKRKLKTEERDFIRDERVLSKIDFHYWRERYAYLIRDPVEGGGLGRFDHLWESQEAILRICNRAEEEAYDAFVAGDPSDGILVVIHKARQLGASLLAQMMLWHRVMTSEHLRALIASVEGEKTRLLYDRGERILNNLPWWLKPSIRYQVKGEHTLFDKLDTIVTLQDAKQTTGLGQGEQWDVSHLTECASWPYPNIIEHDFFPTIPQSPLALSFLESTAQGRGNWWHDFTERVRRGKTRRWRYCFVPWYIETKKYRARPPDNWRPSEISLLHAKLVYETSPEWCGGKAVMLPREQLYWYETSRAEYQEAGKLNLYLTNFCATPEESFQHSGSSSFTPECLEWCRLMVGKSRAVAYDVRIGA
jgi:hypothetical protein